MTNDIQNKVWNIQLIVDDIKKFPQTYNTILRNLSSNGTCQVILRRKLNSLCKDGTVCKTTIPGTRFGKAIFYMIPKKYEILVEADRIGSNVYCFFEYKQISRYYIQLDAFWVLKKGLWIKRYDKRVFEGNVLKWL